MSHKINKIHTVCAHNIPTAQTSCTITYALFNLGSAAAASIFQAAADQDEPREAIFAVIGTIAAIAEEELGQAWIEESRSEHNDTYTIASALYDAIVGGTPLVMTEKTAVELWNLIAEKL